MDKKMKACFTQHAISHSLIGLGIGLILVNFVPALNNVVIGVVVVVVGVGLDMMRKN